MTEFISPRLACLLSVAALAFAVLGCGENSNTGGVAVADTGESRVLGAKETKRLLRQLPYRYEFRPVAKPEGAEAAVAGRAAGRYRTVLNFGIALGDGYHGVPVPQVGTRGAYGYPKGGFVFTDDSLISGPDGRLMANPRLTAAAQWRESIRMAVDMTDKLCLAVTGEHCPP